MTVLVEGRTVIVAVKGRRLVVDVCVSRRRMTLLTCCIRLLTA